MRFADYSDRECDPQINLAAPASRAALGVLQAVAGSNPAKTVAGNPMILWVRSRYESMRVYVKRLLMIEHRLGRGESQAKDCMLRQRLALALLTDFCHDVGISAREVRTLISDARAKAEQAVAFLISQAIRESQPMHAQGRRARAL